MVSVNLLGSYQSCWHEIQRRSWQCLLCWLCAFLVCFYFRYMLLAWVRMPLEFALFSTPPLVSLSVLDGVYVSFELSFYVSLVCCFPLFVWHLLKFLMPALHAKERMFLRFVSVCGGGLFFLGLFVGWGVVLPLLFQYGQFFFPEDVMWLIDLRQYVSLFWCAGIYVGLAFELPLMVFLLSYFDLVQSSVVAQFRPHVFVGCFVCGMLMTPPDMFLQILFAVPLYALFELGWGLSAILRWMLVHESLLIEDND